MLQTHNYTNIFLNCTTFTHNYTTETVVYTGSILTLITMAVFSPWSLIHSSYNLTQMCFYQPDPHVLPVLALFPCPNVLHWKQQLYTTSLIMHHCRTDPFCRVFSKYVDFKFLCDSLHKQLSQACWAGIVVACDRSQLSHSGAFIRNQTVIILYINDGNFWINRKIGCKSFDLNQMTKWSDTSSECDPYQMWKN